MPARQTTVVNFNPRSHEGSDSYLLLHRSLLHYFNPRSHEGSDALGLMANSGIKDFNPRSHEGSDGAVVALALATEEFQSTLPRGERRCKNNNGFFLWISIHAPTRGATKLL